jgi:uncharacterized membrane protein YkoI
MNLVRLLAIFLICSVLAFAPAGANAYDLEQVMRELHEQYDAGTKPDYRVAQNNGGKSLSEAIDQVRQQTGGRILSAETKVSGNREVHHIKVLTKDGKVKTHKVQGRKRGG